MIYNNMKDYSKGKIYCIRSYQTDMVYVGSTIQSLSYRMYGHRKAVNRHLNNKKGYCSSYEIMKYPDAYIELIKLYPCSCRSELEREEGIYMREMNCVNTKIAGRTKKEYYNDNKEVIAVKDKIYCEKNKEKIKIRTKIYNQKNKEKTALRDKKYREKNREKIFEKFNCECGGKYTPHNKKRHFKSQKHQKYLNEKI